MSFTEGAVSGGAAFAWVRTMRPRGSLHDVTEDIWAVDLRGRSRLVARFRAPGRNLATQVEAIVAWPPAR